MSDSVQKSKKRKSGAKGDDKHDDDDASPAAKRPANKRTLTENETKQTGAKGIIR